MTTQGHAAERILGLDDPLAFCTKLRNVSLDADGTSAKLGALQLYAQDAAILIEELHCRLSAAHEEGRREGINDALRRAKNFNRRAFADATHRALNELIYELTEMFEASALADKEPT